MKTVLAFGTFDLLHLGHIAYLRRAKKHGSRLVVVVSRDESVLETKGHLPHFTAAERARFVKELSVVDNVIIGGKGSRLAVITRVKPSVLALGYDHAVSISDLRAKLMESGVHPLPTIVRIPRYRTDRYASRRVCS